LPALSHARAGHFTLNAFGSSRDNEWVEHETEGMEQALECAMSHFRHWPNRKRSEHLSNCFWGGGWLAAVYLDPRTFPHGLTKSERDALVKASFQDGQYHPILLVAVRTSEEGGLFVAKAKVMPDFDAWSLNRGA
jgi:hypothetical protein